MNPKKPKEEKAKNSGISLEPGLIDAAKDYAKKHGFKSISGLARFLLIQKLNDASQKLKESAEGDLKKAREKQAEGTKKVKRAFKK